MKRSSPEALRFLLDGSIALAEVEANGVRVDMDYVNRTSTKIRKRIKRLQEKMQKDEVWGVWKKTFKHKANLGSRGQLGTVLFDKMGFKASEYTASSYEDDGSLKKDARAKTDKTALDQIDLDFITDFVQVENLKKTLSTYLDGLKSECVQGTDGRWYVHAIYNLNSAGTYRSSCQLINFQNQPKRNEEMSKFVRKGFFPHPGHHIVDFDFKTLEVKIGYCHHEDRAMKKYLLDPSTDMHRDSAMELFLLAIDQIDKKTTRDSAKNQFVFPEFYGSVYFQCAKNIWEAMLRKKWKLPDGTLVKDHLAKKGIKSLGKCDPRFDAVPGTFEHHVQQVEKLLWKRFAGYAKWKRDYYDLYCQKGYFEFPTGFVVSTGRKRNDVVNYSIQGSAFHCLLWCLIEMSKWLRKHKMRSKIIGEIHDSASMSVHPKELQDVINHMHHLMTVALAKHWDWIITPMEAEVEVAGVDESWADQKEWVKTEGGLWASKA